MSFAYLVGMVGEAVGITLLDLRNPFLEHFDNFQVVFLQKLQMSIAMNSLVGQLQMLHCHPCLPKELHCKIIVRSMRACFARFQQHGYLGEVLKSSRRLLLQNADSAIEPSLFIRLQRCLAISRRIGWWIITQRNVCNTVELDRAAFDNSALERWSARLDCDNGFDKLGLSVSP